MKFAMFKGSDPVPDGAIEAENSDVVATENSKSFMESILPVFACGSGLL